MHHKSLGVHAIVRFQLQSDPAQAILVLLLFQKAGQVADGEEVLGLCPIQQAYGSIPITSAAGLPAFPRTGKAVIGLDNQTAHAPAVLVCGRYLAEFGKQDVEEILGLPPEAIDTTRRGELAEQLMREPSS